MLLVLLSLLGLFDALYISSHKARRKPLVCLTSKAGSCDTVVHSRYGALLFGIPNEFYGASFYASVLGILIFGWLRIPWVQAYLLLASFGAAALSVVLTYIQARVLKQWCDWCLIANAINVAIFVLLVVSR